MLRIGIAGCGMIAGGPVREGRPILGNHAQSCQDIRGVELVAAADPSAERRLAFAAHWGLDKVYASATEMLSAERLDILIVAFLLYKIYELLKGSSAMNVFIGIAAIYILWWLFVKVLDMELLGAILGQVMSVGVLALIIVFQQEVRRFLAGEPLVNLC